MRTGSIAATDWGLSVRDEYQKQFEQFQSDVEEHSLTVLSDAGLYRHLRCSRGSSGVYSFDIVTWPGYLCYSGDMGCFVFSRLRDMFEFFRGRRDALIDRGYLAEKAVAADKHDGIRQYSEDLFRSAVRADFDAFVEGHELTVDQSKELWQLIDEDVLSRGDTQHDAVDAAIGFRWAPDHNREPRGRQVFTDFWEHRLEDYTSRFSWCCYAIPWAIERYDELRRESPQAVGAVSGAPQVTSE